jgi:hypothetical protein
MTDRNDIIIELIQECLSPDLLHPAFQPFYDVHPHLGHCYVASEALYHLLGGKTGPWKPVRGKDFTGTTHWWLEHKYSDKRIILDPTAKQYTDQGLQPPYEDGQGGGFMTRNPSTRCQELIQRVIVLSKERNLGIF